jgi:hypothetical protein
MAKNTNNSAKPAAAAVAATIDMEAAKALGKSVGTIATSANVQAGNVWAQSRTHYVLAQSAGKASEWCAAFVAGIKSVKGRKAPWARTYSSILVRAAKLGVIIGDDMGANDAQKAVKAAQDAAADPAEKAKQALEMARRFMVAALEAGASVKDMQAALKDAVATING